MIISVRDNLVSEKLKLNPKDDPGFVTIIGVVCLYSDSYKEELSVSLSKSTYVDISNTSGEGLL